MRNPLLLAVAVLLPAAAAHGENALLAPASSPFNERFTERVPVSGRALVGLLATVDADPPAGQGLVGGRLAISASPRGTVCVRARTQDGRYAAENTYDPAAEQAGLRALAWPTAYAAVLEAVPMRQLAVLTTAGGCGEHGAAILPTTIEDGTRPADARFIQVLANTRGATTWAVLRDTAAPGPALRRVRCTRLEEGARVAFDARCPLGPLPEAGRLELRLEQEGRDGRSLEVVERVELGTGSPR